MKKSKPKSAFGTSTPEKLSDLLPAISKEINLDEKVRQLSVLSLWNRLVPGMFKEKTEAVSIVNRGDDRILLVRVFDAALAGELSFHLETVKEALNQFEPQTGIHIDRIQITF